MTVQIPTLKFKVADALNSATVAVTQPRAVTPRQRSMPLTIGEIKATVACAGRRIAPLWPLQNFVAVNPFLGIADQPFAGALEFMARRTGAKLTAPRGVYAKAIEDGRITDVDLAAALADFPTLPHAPTDVASLAASATFSSSPMMPSKLPTVAAVAQTCTGEDWEHFVTEAIARWSATYFDRGQAYWQSPWRDLAPYPAWRAEAAIDRSAELAGIRGFRRIVGDLPQDAMATIAATLDELAIPAEALEAYLHRLLSSIGGWAGHARYRQWQAELRGSTDEALDHLLAIRLTWEVALLRTLAQRGLAAAWDQRKIELVTAIDDPALQRTFAEDLLLQSALEKAYQRQLFDTLAGPSTHPSPMQSDIQAIFCIDVRSEILRRAWETVDDRVETFGFAGFFGFPVSYVRLGDSEGDAHCPALIAPQFTIEEAVTGAAAADATAIAHKRQLRRKVAKAWRSFKLGAVACFGFVGPVGLAYLKNLISDTMGKGRPVAAPATYGLDSAIVATLGPRISAQQVAGRVTGMTLEEQITVAKGALTAMSLTQNFARLVLFVGHGASTVNNPYATGLDCGACGGHSGEANARIAAMVLNEPAVRAGLRKDGIAIPEDTLFLAAIHDTTTDQVMILDREAVPTNYGAEIAQLEMSLAAAGKLARAERAPLLNITSTEDIDETVFFRSRDWSQVRPEWGLAGCAAFIVAPRRRTYGRNLGGRAFLHSYDWRQDHEFGVLESIMTAPMVVASWINLQYYGSSVDNSTFGSGNKVLHNVVGLLGVLEGNGGDLRTGLPWQSVHDGTTYRHEPLRLNVMIEAPIAALTAIIARHDTVRQLLDNHWIYLFSLDEAGRVSHRYQGNLAWAPFRP